MVRVARKLIKGKRYYYLEHTIRDNGKRTTKSKYLGSKLPRDLVGARNRFLFELNKSKWFDDFQKIRSNYNADLKSTPRSAREKDLNEFSVRFTYNTQRIEGSTLTLIETAELLEHKVSPSGKPINDAMEAEAHDRLFHEMLGQKKDLSLALAEEWNWKLLEDTKPDIEGKIRRHGVRISGSNFIPPTPVELRPLMNDFFLWYHKHEDKTNPVELAGLVHLKFVTIHPFTDGNGRIGRLMMNFVLHRHGYPMLNIEYRRRIAYYKSLERSQVRKDERPFINWFFRRYKHENLRYLASSSN